MCFIKKKRFSLPKRAKTDIPCYKLVNSDDTSINLPYTYKSGILKSRFKLREVFLDGVITRGFHSYNIPKNPWLETYDPSLGKVIKIVKCIIPKGTRYYGLVVLSVP